MSDEFKELVKRLRNRSKTVGDGFSETHEVDDYDCNEAADTIERLSERCEAYKGQIAGFEQALAKARVEGVKAGLKAAAKKVCNGYASPESCERAIRALDPEQIAKEAKPDPRDPDPSREGVFRDHNCWKCKNGLLPCVAKTPRNCEFLHARND